METYCEHYVSEDFDDVNLLLDDDNTNCKKCVRRYKKQINSWENGIIPTSSETSSWNEYKNNNVTVNGAPHLSVITDEDNNETPEDSPLLIQDNYDFHCHSFTSFDGDSKAWKKLVSASCLCFIFMVAEFVGGYIAESLAVMTDAAHLLSDFIGFLISLLSIWISRWPVNKNMTFGYYRAEVLGAFLSVLTVWLLAGIFCVLAICRLIKNEYNLHADTMLIVSSIGLIVNIIMAAVLHGICHTHSHGMQSQKQNENINVRAAAAHVLGDLLQSLGVLVAAVIIKLYPKAVIADPICTIMFSIVVVCTTAKVAWDSLWLLLEASPKNCNGIAAGLKNLTGVKHLHSLHMWTLAPGKDAIAAHLAVDEYCDRDHILKKATNLVKSKLNIISCTIQIEAYNAELINGCRQCQLLQC